MLLSFVFENVKSFKQQKEFSLISSSKIQEEEHEIKEGRISIIKNAGIFGANASGKSNIVKAIKIAKDFIVSGRVKERNIEFLDCEDKESSFNFNLLLDEDIYSFSFSLRKSGVVSNYLVSDESIVTLNKDGSIKKIIYSKKDNIFIGKNNSTLKIFYERYTSLPHMLFLTYMNQPDKVLIDNEVSNQLNKIFTFFYRDLIIVDSIVSNYGIINDSNIDDISNILKSYDTGIESAKFIKDDTQDFLKNLPPFILDNFFANPNSKRISISNENELINIKKTKNGLVEVTKLVIKHKNIASNFTFSDESHGTKRLFYLIGLLLGGEIRNKVFVIDEIEEGCHPNLINKLLLDFQNKNRNNNAQLIFTTHLSSLMDDFLRKDEIYFIEKDNFGCSDIYSLLEYKDRTTNISKRYLEGRFGAVPNLEVNIDASIK